MITRIGYSILVLMATIVYGIASTPIVTFKMVKGYILDRRYVVAFFVMIMYPIYHISCIPVAMFLNGRRILCSRINATLNA